eukprot:jgi/Astpho2/2235/Aster-03216
MTVKDRAWLARRLVDQLGWDSVAVEGVVEALAAATSQDDVDDLVQSYMGGNPAAKRLVQQFISANGQEPQRAAGSLQIRHTAARKGKGAAGQTNPEAQLEKKVVNCLACGKIYDCRSQEPTNDTLLFLGSGGICTFCGAKVALTYGEHSQDAHAAKAQPSTTVGTKDVPESIGDQQASSSEDAGAGAEKTAEAIAFKDRLVHYDRNAAQRTNVIDDQSDYFEIDSNAWLTDQERAELKERARMSAEAEAASAKRVTVTVDLLGRRVLMAQEAESSQDPVSAASDAAAAAAATSREIAQGGGTAAGVASEAAERHAARIARNPALKGPAPMFVKAAQEPSAQQGGPQQTAVLSMHAGVRHLVTGTQGVPLHRQGRASHSTVMPIRSYANDAPQNGAASKVFTDWKVYKSGGALSVKFIKPRWRTTDSGALAMDRAGAGFLEFAKAAAESGSSPGERRYDWDRRVTISLGITELGELMYSLSTGENSKPFYHDTHKGKAGMEGTEVKQLTVQPTTSGGRGMFLNMTGKRRGEPDQKVNVKIDSAEIEVLKALLQFAIPRLAGFDEYFAREESVSGGDFGLTQNTGSGSDAWRGMPTERSPY